MDAEQKNRRARWANRVSTWYLLLALLLTGHVLASCAGQALQSVRSCFGGGCARAFAVLTDSLADGADVREAFSAMTGYEAEN